MSSNLTSPTIFPADFGLPEPRRHGDFKAVQLAPAAVRRRWIWPLLIATMIIVASSRSHVAAPSGIANFDKIAHFSVYGLLATLVCRLGRGWRAGLWALLAVSAFGVTDEWHQSFVPGRSCDVFDWVADTSGAALAIALYLGWTWYQRLLESPLRKAPPAANAEDARDSAR